MGGFDKTYLMKNSIEREIFFFLNFIMIIQVCVIFTVEIKT